jgi:hypothetical protein
MVQHKVPTGRGQRSRDGPLAESRCSGRSTRTSSDNFGPDEDRGAQTVGVAGAGEHSRLYHQGPHQVEVYKHVQRGRYVHHRTSRSGQMTGEAATVEQVSPGVWKVCSVVVSLARPEPATTFIDVLKGWGHTWLWDKLKVTGGTSWIANAIAKGTLVAVADGSYIRKQHPDLCAAAFILECMWHRVMLVGSLPEASKAANAYQGELLELMAIHLFLLAVNTVSPGLAGRVKIYLTV